MREVEEMEASFGTAACYRRLWLEDAHTLGLIACVLADVLGWQPTPDEPLPDPLELAEVAAARLAGQKSRHPRRCKTAQQRDLQGLTIVLN